MKRFLTIILVFSSISSFSQEHTPEKEKKHSVGFSLCHFEFTLWHLSNAYPYWYEDEKSFGTIFLTISTPITINYQFDVRHYIKLQTGIGYTFEKRKFEYGGGNFGSFSTETDYEMKYLEVPVNLRFLPFNTFQKDVIGGLFIQGGINFDFRLMESINKYSYTKRDQHFPPPPGYVDPNYKRDEYHSNKIELKKIYPTVGFGHEVVCDRFLFFYGGTLKFESFYHKRTALFSAENVKLSFINGGINYRF